MKKLNKRGTSLWIVDTLPFYIITTVILAIGAIVFVVIMSSISSGVISLPEGLELELIKERAVSPSCFLFTEEGTVPGLIDLRKVEQSRFDECFHKESGQGVRIEIGSKKVESMFSVFGELDESKVNVYSGEISEEVMKIDYVEE
jgi:hypothetical protein|tara:strand:- start:11026 stop:11460 length:435 start_codon:yes stop_codon:yes gene_type:complete